jgi:hypothetical protein
MRANGRSEAPVPTRWAKIGRMALLRWKRPGAQPGKSERETSLRNNPNRYRSFAGAAKAAERAKDRAQAKSYHEKLVALTAPGDGGRTLARRSSISRRNDQSS